MRGIYYCDRHGFTTSEACPHCDEPPEQLLSADRRRQISKFLSGALRHFPGDVGIQLDAAGWTDRSTLLDRTKQRYDGVDQLAIEGIIQTDPKGRFEVDDDRIRATYGHSVAVDLESGGTPVPDKLYHATAPDALSSIHQEGLKPMRRQHVHLSDDPEEARAVGRRHASQPVLLEIDAAAMLADGKTITKRGTNVYTTDHVQPAYLTEAD